MEALSKLRPDTGSSCIWNRFEESNDYEYDVAVIIPVFNSEKYLRNCIDSVLSQKTRFSFRIIAVNDGSTDQSAAILESYSDPRIRIVTQENRGAGAARNAGLQHCRSHYVFFLDSDDVMLPGSLETLVDFSLNHNADILQAAYQTINESGKVSGIVSLPLEGGDGCVINPRTQCSGFPHGKLFNSKVFDHVRFPESYLFEDSVLAQITYPLAERDCLLVYGLDYPCIGYRIHSNSITNRSKSSPRSLDSLWITLSLYRDRRSLGLESDQEYYEYLLNMQPLSWRRAEALGDEVMLNMFTVFRDFLLTNFSSFSSSRPQYHMLEDAIRKGDYGRYRVFCTLH